MNLEVLNKMIETAVGVSMNVANEMVQNTDVKNLVSEIAKYQYHSSMTAAIIAGIVIAVSLIALVIGIKIGLRDDWEFYEILIVVVACALLIFAVAVFFTEMNDVYLAKYFPEKLVLRELKSLLHNY